MIKLPIHPVLMLVFLLIISCVNSFGQKRNQNSKIVLISVDRAADWILDDLLNPNILSENGTSSTIRKMVPMQKV